MLWLLFTVLIILWLLAIATSFTMAGFVHILLILAIVVIIIKIFTSNKTIE